MEVRASVADQIVDLADDYASALIEAWPLADARETIAGAFLSFLSDVTNLAAAA